MALHTEEHTQGNDCLAYTAKGARTKFQLHCLTKIRGLLLTAAVTLIIYFKKHKELILRKKAVLPKCLPLKRLIFRSFDVPHFLISHLHFGSNCRSLHLALLSFTSLHVGDIRKF